MKSSIRNESLYTILYMKRAKFFRESYITRNERKEIVIHRAFKMKNLFLNTKVHALLRNKVV